MLTLGRGGENGKRWKMSQETHVCVFFAKVRLVLQKEFIFLNTGENQHLDISLISVHFVRMWKMAKRLQREKETQVSKHTLARTDVNLQFQHRKTECKFPRKSKLGIQCEESKLNERQKPRVGDSIQELETPWCADFSKFLSRHSEPQPKGRKGEMQILWQTIQNLNLKCLGQPVPHDSGLAQDLRYCEKTKKQETSAWNKICETNWKVPFLGTWHRFGFTQPANTTKRPKHTSLLCSSLKLTFDGFADFSTISPNSS